MAIPSRGFGSYLGLAEETTWGTAVTVSTNWLRVVSMSVKRTTEIVPRPHLGDAFSTSTNRRQHYTRADTVGGQIEILCAYDDSSLMILKHALGAVATTGAGPYTHDFTLATPGPTGLTIQGGYGTGDAEYFQGCKVDSFEWSLTAGDVARLTVDVIGETSGGLVLKSAPTYSTGGEEMLHSHISDFSFNGSTWCLSDITISGGRALTRRNLLGSTLTKEPAPGDFGELTVRFTVEYGQTAGLNAAWLAGTQGDATFTLTGSGNNAATFTLQNLYIRDVSRPINTAGIITQTVECVCEADNVSYNEGLKISIVNDNAAATAN